MAAITGSVVSVSGKTLVFRTLDGAEIVLSCDNLCTKLRYPESPYNLTHYGMLQIELYGLSRRGASVRSARRVT